MIAGEPVPPTRSRVGMLQCLLLLAMVLVPWPAGWVRVRSAIGSARSPEAKRAECEGNIVGYYQGLIGGAGAALPGGERSLRNMDKPSGWVRFQEANVVHYLENDFLQFELKPLVQRTLFGQPFATNAFGMHDDPVTITKPRGTFRIAFLGSSMDMGWGVKYQDTYINQFQEWLDLHASRQGIPGSRRFEVLNFAVAAYSPLQRLETLRRKVLAFHPDLVIYSATTLDTRLMEIHLCEMLLRNLDLKYDFVREVIAKAKLDEEDLRTGSDGRVIDKERIKSKLRPFYWSLYDATLGAIAAECRSLHVPLVMVIIPRVGKADAPGARALSVARLKAVAAHHGLTTFDLSNVFDHSDAAALQIASWDEHPNALGHRRLFLALASAVVRDQRIYRLLFCETEGDATNQREG